MVLDRFVSPFSSDTTSVGVYVCLPLTMYRQAHLSPVAPHGLCVGIYNTSRRACSLILWRQDGTSDEAVIAHDETCLITDADAVVHVELTSPAWCYALYSKRTELEETRSNAFLQFTCQSGAKGRLAQR